MKIAHVALWTRDIDAQLAFWQRYFNGEAGRSTSAAIGRVRFPLRQPGGRADAGDHARADVAAGAGAGGAGGLGAHRAVAGDERQVDRLAQRARQEGILLSAPRWTGDGFYEAVIRDPDGNAIEITA
ncbi:VOC family protein [Serratia ureilytica]